MKFPGKLVPDYQQTSTEDRAAALSAESNIGIYVWLCLVPYIPYVPPRTVRIESPPSTGSTPRTPSTTRTTRTGIRS